MGDGRFLFALAAAFLGGNLLGAPREQIRDSSCLDCHADKTLTKTNFAGKEISLFVDATHLKSTVHATNACSSCHQDITLKHPDDEVPAEKVNCTRCHEQQSQSYGASVHGQALGRGRLDSASCVDCHEGHNVLPPASPASPLHFSKLAQTCGACHPTAAHDLEESVHGTALRQGHREAPTCTDCHSEHRIMALKSSSPLQIAAELCSRCHASEKLNTKYNLPADRVKTFFESYHGLAAQYGSTLAANCASCHGVHRILPSADPRSTIHSSHLVETCGKCHPGATDNFAQSKIHVDLAATNGGSALGEQVNWWVRRIYLGLIVVVIGGMLLHNGLAFARKLAARCRQADLTILRMNLSQRLQHLVLALSFIVLAITGFALRFPDSWIARLLGSSEPIRRWAHRIAGVLLLAAGVYHLVYLLGTRDGRRLLKDFWPRKKDLTDAAHNAGYLIGRRTVRPRIGRFGYAEKLEYWAVVWGTIIMGATGLMIWFKMDVTRWLPRWVVDVALTIHYYEAILACLAIIVWHFYHVIFDPDVYPLNWACWNGKVSRHWQQEEHPLDLQPEPSAKPPAIETKLELSIKK